MVQIPVDFSQTSEGQFLRLACAFIEYEEGGAISAEQRLVDLLELHTANPIGQWKKNNGSMGISSWMKVCARYKTVAVIFRQWQDEELKVQTAAMKLGVRNAKKSE